MNESELISVIIPVYNASQYLEDAVSSIQNQTYSKLEIICVEDCSSDDSLQILERLAKTDSRIQIIQNKQNLGIVGALNNAIKNSKGDIIARMDADDISLPDRIEKQINLMKNGNFSFVGSPVFYISEDGKEMGRSACYNSTQLVSFLKYKSTLGHPTWLMYRNVYDDLNGYRELAPAEDYDFLLRAVHANVTIGMTNEPLLKFRTQSKKGGTALTQGLVQRKMFNYVGRINNGRSNYSEKNIENVKSGSIIGKKLFYVSQLLYYKATSNKHEGNYITAGLFLILSILISPYQLQFVYRAIILKYLISITRS